ncbi:PaaI family thioesterase [Thalassotalea mangrovi]|uniref:PaaI family thioesterase n=2 Tax=Thalassotalea mangrovi TaxID=2572245 RepID=A0A4U1B2C1_9GAMM|nr:PaaI family thioesterase [Thalassotalea mangrovi]
MDDFHKQYSLAGHTDGFSGHIGPFYQKQNVETDSFTRALPLDERHLNPEGVVHGGVLLSFLDYCIYRAIGDEMGHDIRFATININSNFVAAAKAGEILFGQGRVVRKTRSVIFAEGQLFTKRQVMTGTGIWKIINSNN